MMDRSSAEELDANDPLRDFRDRFVIEDPSLLYMDGNSLGRLPKQTSDLIERAVMDGWGSGLVRSWDEWVDLPQRTGEAVARLLGAEASEVIVADSTTVCLYKVLSAAAKSRPEGRVIVVDRHDFPTDRYVASSIAADRGWQVREVASDLSEGFTADDVAGCLDDDAAVVLLSHVNFRSGALADMEAVTKVVRDAGALMIWDLSHAVGAVPIDLHAAGVDAAVGCTYKYLNGGPGAPAFIYLSRAAQEELQHPVTGWFGADEQFEMTATYSPAPGMTAWLSGSPPILSMLPVKVGAELIAEAGIEALRAKSIQMTEMAIELLDEIAGFSLGSPRDPERRGSHIAIRHTRAREICETLIGKGVIPDFRTPDVIRYACAPLYTRFTEMWDAMQALSA